MPILTITHRSDFLVANARAKKFITGTFILQMCERRSPHPAGPNPRFGFTVTKKMGNAVVRNRIKRRLRSALQKNTTPKLDGHDYVLISRHKALDCAFTDLTRDMEFAFSRIITMKDSVTKQAVKKDTNE